MFEHRAMENRPMQHVVQALIAGIIEMFALVFAMAGGGWLEEYKSTKNESLQFKMISALAMSLLLAMCALGVASL